MTELLLLHLRNESYGKIKWKALFRNMVRWGSDSLKSIWTSVTLELQLLS